MRLVELFAFNIVMLVALIPLINLNIVQRIIADSGATVGEVFAGVYLIWFFMLLLIYVATKR